ncbi:hypothetical protein L596_004848 [Steinernema carpocapsae]|uniref:IBB domain-containing protein n=1 Tax=Steinernema carpocapsae TaxID=34508 RepID=A0A4U8UY51_STECR|nr:hypothetical protein L596_004848 [Steinernema carpocapsae]
MSSLQDNNSRAGARDESDRSKMYKNAGKAEDNRRRRTECSVEIRKQKRGDATMKRRNLIIDEYDTGDESQTESVEQKANWSLKEVLECLTNNPSMPQLQIAFESLRRQLSKDKNPPIEEVIRLNLVEAMVRGLSVQDKKVQFESAWGLTNVVSGTTEQTMHAVQKGCVLPLLELSVSKDLKLAEQAVWALANITGEGPQFRDAVLEQRGLEVILLLTQKVSDLKLEFVRTLAWWYSNLCRHKKTCPGVEVLRQIASGINILIQYDDDEVQRDCCWALTYLTDGPDDVMLAAHQAGVVKQVIKFLADMLPKKLTQCIVPAIRVLGNFTSGADELTQVIVDSGVLETHIHELMKTRTPSVLKEVTWLLSNIFAGTPAQITFFNMVFAVPDAAACIRWE